MKNYFDILKSPFRQVFDECSEIRGRIDKHFFHAKAIVDTEMTDSQRDAHWIQYIQDLDEFVKQTRKLTQSLNILRQSIKIGTDELRELKRREKAKKDAETYENSEQAVYDKIALGG